MYAFANPRTSRKAEETEEPMMLPTREKSPNLGDGGCGGGNNYGRDDYDAEVCNFVQQASEGSRKKMKGKFIRRVPQREPCADRDGPLTCCDEASGHEVDGLEECQGD